MSEQVPRDPWGNPDPGMAPRVDGTAPVTGGWTPSPGPDAPGQVPPMGWSPPGSVPPPPPYVGPPRRDGQAVGSLVLGILSLLCMGFVGMFFGAGAVVTGVLSRRRVRDSGGLLEGSGMATAGIVLGALGAVGGAAFFVYVTFINPDWVAEVLNDLAPTTTTTVGEPR